MCVIKFVTTSLATALVDSFNYAFNSYCFVNTILSQTYRSRHASPRLVETEMLGANEGMFW